MAKAKKARARIIDVLSPDYWNGVDEKLLCKRCSDNSEG